MITHDERMAKLPKARREKIKKRAAELHREYTIIKRLRELCELTQKDVESRTGIKQSVISKLENGDRKITLKALSQVVDALGGEWEFRVKLPNRKTVTLTDSEAFRKIA